MGATETPQFKEDHVEDEREHQEVSASRNSQSVTDRIRQIATMSQALGKDDDGASNERVRQIEKHLSSLEILLRTNETSHVEHARIPMTSTSTSPEIPCSEDKSLKEEEVNDIDDADIVEVHNNLAHVVTAMRLRQQEQRHLHDLTVTKIEAVAQRCLFQEQQLQDMVDEMRQLRHENQTLGQENDKLRDIVAELETEASKRETAVTAMTSAVAGLEGWIDDADRLKVDQNTPVTPARIRQQRRAVVRGKGRFRGRHYVDEEHNPFSNGSPDIQELQDGVKAWIRGFRDVEDACSSPEPDRAKETFRRPINVDEDDWGDFETPSNIMA